MPLIFDKNNKLRKRTIEIKEEFVCHSLMYEYFIIKHLHAGDKIPNRVLKKYFSFFTNVSDSEEMLNDLVGKILVRFKEKKYQFSGTYQRKTGIHFKFELSKKSKKPSNNKKAKPMVDFKKPIGQEELFEPVEYSFKNMVEESVRSVLTKMTTQLDQMTSYEVIKISKQMMVDYINKHFSEEHKKLYEKYDYKLGSISAYIAYLLFPGVTSYKNPTNHQLFQYSRHVLNKKKP